MIPVVWGWGGVISKPTELTLHSKRLDAAHLHLTRDPRKRVFLKPYVPNKRLSQQQTISTALLPGMRVTHSTAHFILPQLPAPQSPYSLPTPGSPACSIEGGWESRSLTSMLAHQQPAPGAPRRCFPLPEPPGGGREGNQGSARVDRTPRHL